LTTGFIKPEVWEYIGNQCFECGACSFVCPTCSCFNIEDANLASGETSRLRTWDSCSFEGYTKMAGDHNPRNRLKIVVTKGSFANYLIPNQKNI